MKILGSIWFTQMSGIYIGIVKTQNDIGDVKYYIGSASGIDREFDEVHIANTGATFPKDAGTRLL